MRLNKGMKKAFSLMLSVALIITGLNIGSAKSKAAEDTALYFNATDIEINSDDSVTVGSKEGSLVKDLRGDSAGGKIYLDIPVKEGIAGTIKDIAGQMKEPTIDVSIEDTEGNGANVSGLSAAPTWWENLTYTSSATIKYSTAWEAADNASIVLYAGNAKKIKSVSVKLYDAAAPAETPEATVSTEPAITEEPTVSTEPAITEEPTVEPTEEPTETPVEEEPTEAPTEAPKGKMGDFNVKLSYVGDDSWGEQTWGDISTHVSGDGDYKLEYTAQNDSTGIFIMILDTDLYKGSLSEDFKFTVKSVQVGSNTIEVDNTGCWGFADQKEENNYRFNVVNPWNGLYDSTGLEWQDETVTSMDKLNKATVKAGDKITVNFNVTTKKETTTTTTKSKAKVTVGKKKVTVKAGKSVTVSYKALNKSGKAVKATATSANKKVAKVTVSSKSKLKISVPKKVKAGKSTKITVKSSGKKAVITVKVAKK